MTININPKNKGKLTATAKKTGKSFTQLSHSKNPLTRKRAIFALNARKWNHKHADGGTLDLYDFDNTFANGGNLSRAKDYGSSKHPYPMVKSSDFAGGGRSYPIPTKANAIDALRLAGLHHRPDVKAKVYAKYPDLKHADGGFLYNNSFGEGGQVNSDVQHGGVFNNGTTDINNGGTHEQNPYQGVPMGVDSKGTPNLVEQGEVVHNNYVYSNRLNPTKEQLKSVGLSPSYSKYSYSKIANVLNKESKERPNDPISKNGLNSNMQKLQAIQEQTRQAKQQQEQQLSSVHAFGGNLFDSGGNYSIGPNGSLIDNSIITPEQRALYNLANYKGTNSKGKAVISKTGHYINNSQLADLVPTKVQGNLSPTNVTLPANMVTASKGNIAVYPEETKVQNNNLPTWMRYSPIIGSGLGVLSDTLGLTNKPDYTQANAIQEAVSNPNKASFTPVSNYLTYNPFDRNYYLNKLNAQTAATQRALVNNGGGNRATTAAGLLAGDYNSQGRMGDLFRQSEEYNQNQRNQVAEFNRGTNEFNSQGALQASQANMANNSLGLQAAIYGSQMRQQQDQLASQMRSNNLTNFLQNMGNLGTENYAYNQAANNRALYYGPGTDGSSTYKGNQHKYGGKLNKKKGYTTWQ